MCVDAPQAEISDPSVAASADVVVVVVVLSSERALRIRRSRM